MDFDEAIAAHSAWKNKLKTYLRQPNKSLDANTVASDNQCVLGKWLYGEGAKHSALPEFKELKNLHANFHRAAADLIKRADAGEHVAEEAVSPPRADYYEAEAESLAGSRRRALDGAVAPITTICCSACSGSPSANSSAIIRPQITSGVPVACNPSPAQTSISGIVLF